MLPYNKQFTMFNSVIKRRDKHLEQLRSESATASQIKTWEKFYDKMLKKYSTEVVQYA